MPLADAIAKGQAPDGGLFMPPRAMVARAARGDTLQARALGALTPFFEGDRLLDHLPEIVADSFTFDAPTKWITPDTALLQLYWGPTAAFKDFGARFLANCLARLRRPDREQTVLVATSGDTGAAVAAAFHGRPGFRVAVLYPDGRVSPRQAHQLGAFGENVAAYRVAGSFDDCQAMVKAAFADAPLSERHGLVSANSISLGRLLPQMSYYAHAAVEAAESGHGPANFVIPTGNLGNALACLIARDAGLPIGDVVMATNANRVVPDFLATGAYAPTASLTTLANAMDVGAPSNLERLRERFTAPAEVVQADWVDDDTIRETIRETYAETGEIICPHTACGLAALKRRRGRGEDRPWIVAATAHAAKFAEVVEALVGTSPPVPAPLAELLSKPSSAAPMEPNLTALGDALEVNRRRAGVAGA